MSALRIHPEAREERRRAIHLMRNPGAAQRFDTALRRLFAAIREDPTQFREHGLLAVQNGRPLFYPVRRAGLERFPYVVFFYVRRGTAIVLAIAHGRRRPGYWSERR
jgi:plasmid stabilization system protein ParE